MPLEVRIDPELRVIFVDGEGVVTDADLLWYVEEYLAVGTDFRDLRRTFRSFRSRPSGSDL